MGIEAIQRFNLDQALTIGNYGISHAEVAELSAEAVYSRGRSNGPYTLYSFQGADELADTGRYIETEVFNAKFGNGPDVMIQEYGPYEDNSELMVTIQHKEDGSHWPVSALRIITLGEAGLKTLVDAREEPFNINTKEFQLAHRVPDLSTVWDLGTFAVLPEMRGRRPDLIGPNGAPMPLSTITYRAKYAESLRRGVTDWVAAVDGGAHQVAQIIGMPFKPMLDRPAGPYLGSSSTTFLHARVADIAPAIEERERQVAEFLNSRTSDSASPEEAALVGKARTLGDSIAAMMRGHVVDKLIHFDY
jgi:hypothetical protein